MNDTQKKYMSLSIWVSVVLFAIRLIIAGITMKLSLQSAYELFGYAGEAIGAAAVIMFFYNKCLWKKVNFYSMPVLASHYEGKLMYTWKDQMGERDVVMDIKQTFLNVKVSFGTSESTSDSINASITYINDEPYLQYLYLNTPNPNLREISSIHYGHASFKLKNTDSLTGDYFTDRNTVGRIEVKAVLKKEDKNSER